VKSGKAFFRTEVMKKKRKKSFVTKANYLLKMKKNIMVTSLSETSATEALVFEKAIAQEILKGEKNLIKGKKRISGRNNQGRITVRRRGGGHKRNYRMVTFSLGTTGGIYSKTDLEYMVYDLVYDPNRTAPLALIGPAIEKTAAQSLETIATLRDQTQYIIAPKGIVPGDIIKVWGFSVAKNKNMHWRPSLGDSLPLWQMPLGSIVHNIEEQPGKGGQYIRAGGGYGQILDKVSFEESTSSNPGNSTSRKKMTSRGHPFLGGKVLVRLPSGEKKWFPSNGRASFGAVSLGNVFETGTASTESTYGFFRKDIQSNTSSLLESEEMQTQGFSSANYFLPKVSLSEGKYLSFGKISKKKAGRSRWLGRRPKVRGVAMNPVDHPHGGRTSGGRPSVTPWGRPTKGWKTRSPKKTAFQYKGRIINT
jgi:ribosomal protein L2